VVYTQTLGAGSTGAPTGNAFGAASSDKGGTSPAVPLAHTTSTYMLLVFPISISKQWRRTLANPTDISTVGGSTGTHGNSLGTVASGALSGGMFGAGGFGAASTGAALSFGFSAPKANALAFGPGNPLGAGSTGAPTGNAFGAASSDKGKEEVELNTEADPSNSDNQRKRKADGNLALHAQLMMALLHPPTEIAVKSTIPPSLLPATEIYNAFKLIYDEARHLSQAMLDRNNQRGLFCLSLRTISAAKFLPFHFLIGNLLDTKPIGLYIHSPSTDPSALAWDWQIHWIKLYFKSGPEANTAFHMVTKQNTQLKSTMPKITNWEVTDPLGNLILNPNATESQQQAASSWLITISTLLLVPRGKYYCCPQTTLQNTQYTHMILNHSSIVNRRIRAGCDEGRMKPLQ